MKKLLSILFIGLVIVSCDRDLVGPQRVNGLTEPTLKGRKVILINEGNFQRGNASISAYEPGNGSISHSLYSAFNDEKPLGDVAQDFQQYQGRHYVVVNNSGLVRVLDTTNFKSIANIDGLTTPRFIAFDGNRAFVTDLFDSKLWVLDLNLLAVETSINLPSPSFHITQWNQKIGVGVGAQLAVIDPISLTIDSLITLQGQVERMVSDQNGRFWVLCKKTTSPAKLYQLNSDWGIAQEWTFSAASDPSFLSINKERDQLLFYDRDGIYEQSISATSLAPSLKVSLPNQNVYGFDVDSLTNDLYISDALDFDQAADIYHYSNDGNLVKTFKGGVITNGFRF